MAKVLMQVLRSYWPKEDERVPENLCLDLEADEALKLSEEGIAKRAPAGAKAGDIIQEPEPKPAAKG